MTAIRLEKRVEAPQEYVFELLSEHDRYDRFRPIDAAELTREGDIERNGVGARRRIRARPLTFEEEITAFERPRRLDYVIREVNIPLRHHGGSITLTPAGAATDVVWASSFEIEVPVVGGALAGGFAVAIKRSFSRILEDIERSHRTP
jgi:uncharacterized protein YndB with AHSA1/START domain